MSESPNNTRVCGVDGCRGGWVVASPDGISVVRSLDELADEFDLVGIDMPIGLSDTGPRLCDVLARKALPGRGSTVFPTPPRSLLGITDYATANILSKERFGRGVTRQSFAIWPKIRELDVLAQDTPERFVEIHPECAFARMTGIVPPTKHAEPGKKFRRDALKKVFGGIPGPVEGAGEEDVLDALAVLWSALRYARGVHVSLGDGSRDACGLPMRIVV